MPENDQNQTSTSTDGVDGFSDSENGTVDAPDKGNQSKLEPLSADERAREEEEIRADGGAEDLKK